MFYCYYQTMSRSFIMAHIENNNNIQNPKVKHLFGTELNNFQYSLPYRKYICEISSETIKWCIGVTIDTYYGWTRDFQLLEFTHTKANQKPFNQNGWRVFILHFKINILRNIFSNSKVIKSIEIHLHQRFGNCYMDKNIWKRIENDITWTNLNQNYRC